MTATLEPTPVVAGGDEALLAPRTPVPSPREIARGLRPAQLPAEPAARRGPQRAEPARGRPGFLRGFVSQLNLGWLRESHSSPVIFATVIALSIASNLDGAALSTLLIAIQRDLSIRTEVVLNIATYAGVLSTFMGPLIGYYGDRLPRLRMLSVFAVVGGLASASTFAVTGILGLVISRSIAGTGSGLSGPLSPLRPGLLSDAYPVEVRGRMFATSAAYDTVASLIAPLAAGILSDSIGWRPTFVIFAIPLVVIGVIAFFIREPKRGEPEREETHSDTTAPEPPPLSLAASIRTVAAVRTLRRIWYAQPFLFFGGGGIYVVNYVVFTQRFHATTSTIGGAATAQGALLLLGALTMGPLVDRQLKTRPGRLLILVGCATAFSGVSILVMTFVPVLPLAIALSTMGPFVSGMTAPVQASILVSVLPPRVRTFGMSTLGLSQFLVYLLAPVIYHYATSSDPTTAALVFLPIFLVGAAILASTASGVGPDARAALAAAAADAEARRSGGNTLLVCRGVEVEYSGVRVLFGVDLDVRRGEIVALLGTNGAGKSTLLRAISGLSEASGGAIVLDGRDITHLPTTEITRLGAVQVLGGRAIFPNLTVADNLRVASWVTADDAEFVARQTDRILTEFFPNLRDRLGERAGSLSGGEQQMVALSQAFLMKPTLLMIDELSLGLSPAVVEQLLTILRAIHAEGTTIILVEQSVNVALTVAERAVFMEKGEVRFEGPTAELLRRPDIMRSVFFAGATSASAPLSAASRADERTSTVALQVEDVACTFGGVRALRGVSLTVGAGEIVGIIGPNGAGKTTLFDAISGFVPTVSGTVGIAGRDVTALDPDGRARVGLARSFQDARLFPSLTVLETIAVAMERQGAIRSAGLAALWLPPVRRSEARLRRRAAALVELLGLGAYAEKLVGELSTGTRRVVDLACMIAAQPEVLLLDEPSSGIAQAEVQEMANLLRRVRAETGCALLVIEHDMSLIASISDRLVAMELGAVVTEGEPAAVLADPRVVASYLGTARETVERSGSVPVPTPMENR